MGVVRNFWFGSYLHKSIMLVTPTMIPKFYQCWIMMWAIFGIELQP